MSSGLLNASKSIVSWPSGESLKKIAAENSMTLQMYAGGSRFRQLLTRSGFYCRAEWMKTSISTWRSSQTSITRRRDTACGAFLPIVQGVLAAGENKAEHPLHILYRLLEDDMGLIRKPPCLGHCRAESDRRIIPFHTVTLPRPDR